MNKFKRNAIQEDLLFFAIPAVFIFFAGLVVSMFRESNSFAVKIQDLIIEPQSISTFSFLNFLSLFLVITGLIIMITAQITLGKFYSSTW